MPLRYQIALTVFVLEAVMVFMVLHVTLDQTTEATAQIVQNADNRLLTAVSGPARNALLTEEYGLFEEHTGRLIDDSHVNGMVLLGSNGDTLSTVGRQALGSAAPGSAGENAEYWLWQSIDGPAGHLGKIGIRFSNAQLNHEVLLARNTGILVAVACMAIIAMAGIGAGVLLARRLEYLSKVADRFAAGDIEARAGFRGKDEISRLGLSLDGMAEQIGHNLRELGESERRNRLLVEGGPVATVVFNADDFHIVDANQQLAELTRYPINQLIGMTPEELSPEIQKDGRKTSDVATELIRRAFAGECPRTSWLVRDATSRIISCELHISAYPGEGRKRIIGVLYDVTERERVSIALARRMQFDDLMVQQTAKLAGLTAAQVDQGIQELLSEVGQFAGVDRSYLFEFSEDMSIESCTHEWCAKGIEPTIGRLQNLPLASFPWFMERIGRGEVLHVPRVSALPGDAAVEKTEFEAEGIQSVLMVPLGFGGRITGYMGFDAVRQEIEWQPEMVVILQLAGDLVFNALRRQRSDQAVLQQSLALARSNEELQQFAYVASHDLREPLRAISGFAALLADRYKGRLDQDADEFIGYITDAAQRMTGMIGDLLDYARVDSRAEAPTPCDMNHILEIAKSNLMSVIQECQADITHDALPTVMADSTQMVQLLQNLLGNAIKFRRDERPVVHISAQAVAEGWHFSVRDNGIGIDPKMADSVFKIFKRLHASGQFEGSGIGLAVCKRIVERSGGRIWVEANDDHGCTFHFLLSGTA
jgi:PAS domain S-box-containing protein